MIGCSLDLGFWYWFVLGAFSFTSYALVFVLNITVKQVRNIAGKISGDIDGLLKELNNITKK